MSSRDHGSSSLRPRQHEDIRPSRSLPYNLSYKRSVEDYFSSSRFLSAAPSLRALQKSKTLGAPTARAPTHDIATRHPHPTQKRSDSGAREPIKDTFLWAKGELIGQGSHGKVYLGFNATTGELMAVKQVEVPLTADDRRKAEIMDFVQTLRSERETLRDLDHPNIVEYLGFEENPETVNIFLQYVSGGTISRCLREYGPFREEVTKSFTRQILEGISYLHSNGIIHRDLKSDNILIELEGICKISDFGISKKLDLGRTYSSFKGTSYWMAPEMVLAGNVGYNSKVDIWSIGCIVFEMWTAKRPWYNETNVWQVIEKLTCKEAPPLPRDFHSHGLLEHFRKECFQPDPAQRPAAETLLIHPYLQLPQGWTFPGMFDMGDGAVAASVDLDSSKSLSRPSSPAFTMNSGVMDTVSDLQPNPPRPISPQLVIIAPPPPRKLPTPQSSDQSRDINLLFSSDSLEIQKQSQSSADSGAQRKLDIHDPKTIPDLTKPKKRGLPKPPVSEPFVYKPPDLPAVSGDTPYSNSLAPQPRFIAPPAIRRIENKESVVSSLGQNSSSTLSLPTMPRRMGPANLKDAMSHVSSDASGTYYSDGDSHTVSTSYSGWQRPPPHSALSTRRRPSLPSTPTPRNKPISPNSSHRQSAAFRGVTRPDNRQVLEHMTVYFPDHNLDEPLVSSPIEPGFMSSQEIYFDAMQTRRFAMKSIKSIAEEKINRDLNSPNRRRQTRLWGSNIEEIRAHK